MKNPTAADEYSTEPREQNAIEIFRYCAKPQIKPVNGPPPYIIAGRGVEAEGNVKQVPGEMERQNGDILYFEKEREKERKKNKRKEI